MPQDLTAKICICTVFIFFLFSAPLWKWLRASRTILCDIRLGNSFYFLRVQAHFVFYDVFASSDNNIRFYELFFKILVSVRTTICINLFFRVVKIWFHFICSEIFVVQRYIYFEVLHCMFYTTSVLMTKLLTGVTLASFHEIIYTYNLEHYIWRSNSLYNREHYIWRSNGWSRSTRCILKTFTWFKGRLYYVQK